MAIKKWADIIRGTTPTIIYNTSIDLSEFEVVWVSFKQNGRKFLEKSKADCTFPEEKKMELRLSQEDTLKINKYNNRFPIYMQIRVKVFESDPDADALASNWMEAKAGLIIKDGVI